MRRRAYTEDYKRVLIERVRDGEGVTDVALAEGVNRSTLRRWCKERGVLVREQKAPEDDAEHASGSARELHIIVPTNRVDEHGMPTHMDGWNEILCEYKKNRHKGAKREQVNVKHVAKCVAAAMHEQGWRPMASKAHSVPCSVTILFIERDRRRDIGNIHGGAKYALDALTYRHPRGAGAIYDDSRRWLSDVTYVVTTDAANPGMKITVRELKPRPSGRKRR